MYNGQLLTFRIKDYPHLVCTDLSDIEIQKDEKGVLLIQKSKNNTLGYLENVYGIDLIEFMRLFGYEYIEDSSIHNV